MQRNFKLMFRDSHVADVVSETDNWDFPGYSGHFSLPEGLKKAPELDRIRKYIDASIAASAEAESEDYDPSGENEFLDLIESSEWFMVDSSGSSRPILCPIFHTENELVWRDRVDEPEPSKRPWWKFW